MTKNSKASQSQTNHGRTITRLDWQKYLSWNLVCEFKSSLCTNPLMFRSHLSQCTIIFYIRLYPPWSFSQGIMRQNQMAGFTQVSFSSSSAIVGRLVSLSYKSVASCIFFWFGEIIDMIQRQLSILHQLPLPQLKVYSQDGHRPWFIYLFV